MLSLKLHKTLTDQFWRDFSLPGSGRKGVSSQSKEATIAAIKVLGDAVIVYTSRAQTPAYTRKRYERYKSNLKGYNGFVKCFACQNRAEVRHHLIWIKNGGRNHKRNIVGLCRKCHAEIHPWLSWK